MRVIHTHRSSFLIFLLGLGMFFGCEKSELGLDNQKRNPDILQVGNVSVVDKELHFLNPETYFEDVSEILEMDELQLNKWEENIGFRSLRSWINEANDAFGKLTSKDQILDWQEKYKDIVVYRDSTVLPIISNRLYQTIANRSGEYMIGKRYVKVVPGKTMIIMDGDRSRISEALQLENTDLEKGITISKYETADKLELRGICGVDSRFEKHSEKDKRRTYLEFNVFEHSQGALSQTEFYIATYGKRKKTFGWKRYSTNLYMEQINFEFYNNFGIKITPPYERSLTTTFDVRELKIYGSGSDLTLSHLYDIRPKFYKVKGRSTSRGTDSNWAVVCCGGYLCPSTDDESPYTP